MSNSLKILLQKLNLLGKDEMVYFSEIEYPKLNLTIRIKETIKKLKPDAFFCINDEPLILFFDNPDNIDELYKKCWNFNQAPVIFIIQPKNTIIYNGFNYLKENKVLSILSDNEEDFDYFKIITGETWGKYKKNLENKNRVDTVLLKSIEDARNKLIDEYSLPNKTANFLIGRIIFLRYLIDRKVELNKKYGILSKEDFYKILASKTKAYQLFKKIKKDFNGNLFPIIYHIDNKEVDEEDLVDSAHLSVIIDLLRGTDIANGQPSFFDIFDFEILPIEFISNVYEKFIGKTEQAKTGAYYTPLFLVDYIQKETVSKYFENYPKEYNCKVLDPACGSGIFLVETYRQIITQYQKNNKNFDKDVSIYKETLKTLLVDNLFGIDKDESAISVAIFSLYITLLDYLTPSSIIDFQFPPLLNTNFFVDDFFDTKVSFNSILKDVKLQFVLGNPPWCTTWEEKQEFETYIENRKSIEKSNLEIENREIAEAFLVRISDFNVENCALIVTSKVLYKISRKKNKKGIFRNYFLSNFKINQVFELSSVRHQVFDKSNDKAVAPSTILFYCKSNNIEINRNNVIKHISLKPNIFFEYFKLLVIEKYDYKEIQQKYFLENDWIWKVMVYGNILDYEFINRFKKNKSIFECISDKERFIYGKGISIGGGDKNNIDEHKKIQYSINSMGKGLKPYFIKYDTNFLEELEFVHRPRNINLFKASVLLVGKGISKDFKAKSAISYKDVIYTDAITGIKALYEKDTYILETLLALFNSDLFSYFLMLTNSSIGIEREQAHDKDDKFSVPFVHSKSNLLSSKTEELAQLITTEINCDFETIEKHQLRKKISELQKEINTELLHLYQVSEKEKTLLNYTKSITLPLLKGSEIEKSKVISKIRFEDKFLNQYAKIFITHFGKRFNSDGKYFESEIIHSNHTILMKFKVIPQPSKNKECIIWTENTDVDLLKTISKLSFEKHSSHLFIQKDIKGFEKDFFYVAKPNQYKSWHPAIAYLDLAEFMDALHENKPQSIVNG
jgi:N-6 DNA Methylase